MKTTIDLPDDLLREAKLAALDRKTTLRELVTRGLVREIQSPSTTLISPISALRSLDLSIWKTVTADDFVEQSRKDWT